MEDLTDEEVFVLLYYAEDVLNVIKDEHAEAYHQAMRKLQARQNAAIKANGRK